MNEQLDDYLLPLLSNGFYAVIDGRNAATGSCNWTENAEQRNRGEPGDLECPEIAQAFSREWESIPRDAP